jgi:hypothetical protein
VEVAQDGDRFLMRSSRNPEVVLSFDRDEWVAFTEGVRANEF